MAEASGGTYVLQLPHGVEAAALARRFITEHGHDLPEHLLHDAELLVSELVTNAVVHGRPQITLRMALEPALIGVSVEDDGDALPPPAPDSPEPDQAHGRGLFIVDQLASRWGISPSDAGPGKAVWFHLEPDVAPGPQ